MSHDVEVGTKLTLDDHASEGLHKIKEGFEHIGEKVHEVQHEMVGFLKQAAAVAVGFEMTRGLDSIKEFGEEVIHAATGVQNQRKELAGLLAMSDQTGASFEELQEKAAGVHEELETMGIKAGVATSTMIDSFSMIAARSQKSSEAIVEMVGQMGMAGKAIPGGAEALAGAFRDMEAGIVRPRSAIVQLIKQTHTAQGSAKQISKALTEMMQKDPEKAYKLAETAIGKMAEKMKDAPATFESLVQSLKDIREQFYATMGAPMMKALSAPLEKMKAYFIANKEKFTELAETLGTKVGEWMTAAADKIESGFKYLQTHSEEIMGAIESGAKALMEALKFLVDHKEIIMMAYGAKTAVGVAGTIGEGIGMAKTLGGAGVGLARGAAGVVGGMSAEMGGMIGTGAAMGGLALAGVFTVAAAAWYEVYEQGKELYAITGGGKSDAEMGRNAELERIKALAEEEGAWTNERDAEFSRLKKSILDSALAAGENTAALGGMIDAMFNARKAANESMAAIDEAAKGGDADAMLQFYNMAEKSHDAKREKYIADLIDKSAAIKGALATSGDTIVGGMDHLLSLLSPNSREAMQSLMPKTGNGKDPAVPPISFPGATINIKQDFRDQDPDRIMTIFRKDIGHAAMFGLGAKTG